MSDEFYDDGLVHGHHWAREAMPEGITRHVAPVAQMPLAANDTELASNPMADIGHDDGLVHDHSWARAQA